MGRYLEDLEAKVKIRAYGVPIPQGSTRAFAIRKGGVPTGGVVVTADNPKSKSWRQSILDAVPPMAVQLGGPVRVTIVFLLPRPAHHYGTGRNAGQVKPGAPRDPAVKPDVDKLARAVLDALKAAGVYRDDAQVCRLSSEKDYAGPGEKPGALIEVAEIAR
jgi:crossover junction endodeoxyribonuclease RusA